MIPILSGNVASATAGAYEVANSCRFDDGSSAYMNRTPSAGNTKTYTISVWIKRSNLGIQASLLSVGSGSGSNPRGYLWFNTSDQLGFDFNSTGSSWNCSVRSTQVLRDCSAWYHLCIAVDTEQGVAANRVKMYINGTQVTNLSASTYPAEDATTPFMANLEHNIGRYQPNGSEYTSTQMSEFVIIDGQALAPTSFGEFDSDTPTVFKPIDVSGLTAGTAGTYLDFEDSSNLGNDAFGGTDWTENNLAATDQTTDTPTNNFCTLNPLDKGGDINTMLEGNLKATWNSNNGHTIRSTMAVSNGKWYWETANADNLSCGIVSTEEPIIPTSGAVFVGSNGFGSGNSYGYGVKDGKTRTNSVASTYGEVVDNSEILGCALDLDNGRIYWSVDGVWQNSGNPEDGTNPAYTGIETGGKFFSPAWAYIDTGSSTLSVNFGSPPYANSSDAADGNGYGAFEYAPPSGYLALCTKNLAEEG